MRKSTFVKLVVQLNHLNQFKEESMPSPYLDLYTREIDDAINMIRQALEEDTCACWKPEMRQKFLECPDIYEAEKLYDQVMEHSYNHSASRGVTLQQMLTEGIVDHNAVVTLWERDKENPHYSNLVWKGEFWKLPSEYKNRAGQIHGVMSDPKDTWGDDVHVELLPVMGE